MVCPHTWANLPTRLHEEYWAINRQPSDDAGFSGTWRISADRGPTDGYMNTTVFVKVSAEGQRPDLEISVKVADK